MKDIHSEPHADDIDSSPKERHWSDILAPVSNLIAAILAIGICLICGYLYSQFTTLKSDASTYYEAQAPDLSGLNIIAENYSGELSLIADEHTGIVYYLNPKTGDIACFYSEEGNPCIYDEDDSVITDAVTKDDILEIAR